MLLSSARMITSQPTYFSCIGFLYNDVLSSNVLHLHSVFYGRCPAYLTANVQSLNSSRPHLCQHQRSTSSTDFSVTAATLYAQFGERAFSHVSPAAWNSLPEHIRAEPDIGILRKLLKTHLFNIAFNVH